jgi:DNA-binding CsgD family transcriptional regulator
MSYTLTLGFDLFLDCGDFINTSYLMTRFGIGRARPSSQQYATPAPVKRLFLIYGVCGGLLIVFLQLIEYRFLVVEHSLELYGALIAAIFAAVGILLGIKLTRKEQVVVIKEVAVRAPETFRLDEAKLGDLGITPRELEILQLMSEGLSNREIAERLFVSENTVKTHSSRLFEKLSAKRRTQAVQIGKELGLIP